MMKHVKARGFTLIEILLVVAAIAILAGIVILAINPGKQLGDTRNAQRRADVTTVLNAVYQYYIDTGHLPTTVPTSTAAEICRVAPCGTGTVDLSVLTADEEYLTAIPADPITGTTNGAGYTIFHSTNNRVTVAAPGAEQGQTISVTR
jgi:prepilin-type N-terminal cleavage/methylation domain-containing protein